MPDVMCDHCNQPFHFACLFEVRFCTLRGYKVNGNTNVLGAIHVHELNVHEYYMCVCANLSVCMRYLCIHTLLR